MQPHHALRRTCARATRCSVTRSPSRCVHSITYDGRNRLSNFWTPTHLRKDGGKEETHDLLLRAGFLRQPHSGLFHLLPLGLRVQDKIERLIDKHMLGLGAARVSLSSLTSEDLWRQSGRLQGRGSELFHLQDRKDAKYLLAPTHEEEITTIVRGGVHSYKDLPLRLYQVSRKYRDEARPRQGLLRGREFLMKDLYTFDASDADARLTYESVKKAYAAFLDELRLPYLVANADSGDMGGTLSHEYHFVSENGEDTIVQCTSCGHTTNEELWTGENGDAKTQDEFSAAKFKQDGIDVEFRWPFGLELNQHIAKRILRDLSIQTPLEGVGRDRIIVSDPRIAKGPTAQDEAASTPHIVRADSILTRPQKDDTCPRCHTAGSITTHKAVEIGHTFHLGTRYSVPLDAHVLDATNKLVPISMGCHGIGVSRLIAAIADMLADGTGLNWPMSVAPFGVMIIATPKVDVADVEGLYDSLAADRQGPFDVAIDDRQQVLGWRLNDADLVGYPIIVVMGKGWGTEEREVEVQCRRLGVKENVPVQDLAERIRQYARQL